MIAKYPFDYLDNLWDDFYELIPMYGVTSQKVTPGKISPNEPSVLLLNSASLPLPSGFLFVN